ncbi:hypothetical protein RD792_016927 [Penstemon davidsonii]|uniref:Peptidase A1 domain-containing protein n=1 Tax=Penstemon davidsonii TaxID=160366 RepID=A0ABR0CL75_9LAMI|nr:hypothetical protein RD792_016927 [Penstemon davidsonii]
MASSTLSILILFSLLVVCSFSNAKRSPPKPKGFIFPIKKNETVNQYYTSIQIGSNSTKLNVVIDISGNFLWFSSDDYFSSASGYLPIPCDSKECNIANGVGCILCEFQPPVPKCITNMCADYALNPYSGTQGYNGLSTDVLHVYSTHGQRYNFKRFPFQYSDTVLRQGLASSTQGVISLGRTRISLQAQLASAFKIREKFALCVPSSGHEGNLIIGNVAYNKPIEEISKSLISTPLIRNPVSTSGNEVIGNLTLAYFINVKSIRVNNKTLSFNNSLLSIDESTGGGGTCLRTVRSYTSLHRSIYRALLNEFVKAAASQGIKRVASVAPFGACFDAKTIASGKIGGPQVPIIDLVMEGKNVFWRFYGSNSMVRVSKNVICLSFEEGSPNLTGPTTSIVVGGYQMENYLLEFDVTSSKLRFSPSLLLSGTSCSQFGAS